MKQLDLVAFFWSDWRVKNYVQTALYLKELKDEGLIKEIGVLSTPVGGKVPSVFEAKELPSVNLLPPNWQHLNRLVGAIFGSF